MSISSATSLLGETQWHRSRLDKLCDPAVQRGVREGLPQQSRRGNLTLSQDVLKAKPKPTTQVWSSLSRLGEGTLEEMEDGFHLCPLALAKATQMILNLVRIKFIHCLDVTIDAGVQ